MLQLHEYQIQAIDHLHRNPRAALFLEMGLGKTAITLRALTPDHLPALVTAPKRVTEEVWPVEARKWRPDLTIAIAAGPQKKRMEALSSGADIVVIGRDNLTDATAHSHRFRTFILDELSGFKSRATKRWKAARQITRHTPFVWGLTGTPAPNGLMDLWSQIYLLDEGARLGTTITGFRSRYFYPARQLAPGVMEWRLRPESEKAIHRKLQDICLSMSAEGRVKVPPVTWNEVRVQLPSRARQVYRQMKDTLIADLQMIGLEGIRSAANAAVLTGKLSQISAGFIYPNDWDIQTEQTYDILHKEKISAVREVVDGTGSPVLVFYRFRAEREMLSREFPEARAVGQPRAIEEWNEGKVPVLLAHPASAGHGLNIQYGGHTIVWTTMPWSPEEWDQANSRLIRQGQEHPVVVHMIMANRTIDDAIKARLGKKATVQQALLSHLESPL